RPGHSCGGGAGATMRRLHLVVGLVGLLAFLASGQYMDLGYDHLRRLDDTRRMLFRSTHIYLLFAALLNLALGLYLVAAPAARRRRLGYARSALVVVAPALLGGAVFVEAPPGTPPRAPSRAPRAGRPAAAARRVPA